MTQKDSQAPLALAQLTAKKIVVLGAGLTGLSCVRYLAKNGLSCSVNDSRDHAVNINEFQQDFPNTALTLGRWDKKLIASADVLLVSPGIDTSIADIAEQISNHCIVAGDVELYCQNNHTAILAVTGSNGKSTVVSLLAFIGQKLAKKVELGGNIGVPVLEQSHKSLDCLVLELSSFQLETLRSMNAIAATVLNVSDDHLDRHKTLGNYAAIKQGIYQQCQTAITNRDDVNTQLTGNAQQSRSFGSDAALEGDFGMAVIDGQRQLMFGSMPLIGVNQLPIAGLHNALNCLAVLALGHSAGWPLDEMLTHLVEFKGLAHRCQLISTYRNVQWINDSKATNVGATLAAIEGLAAMMSADNNLYVIAGGDGKGADFSPLESVFSKDVSHVFTLGKDGDEVAAIANKAQIKNSKVSSIEVAINTLSNIVKSGDVVLLSPACASIDMFKNFAERGEFFVNAVNKLSLENKTPSLREVN
ncbi:UDP-N-acetylmuramoyl-L-alanine--D-glutamate ligase [Colwellia hornerae]|uniref:UDP-N-acetylmuramoylalanine--D-glutamate ligase n=1 Tax=Colwellia hornerae TaxID=89402 RepID=A0A5C6QU90_9GAMM|nr:UDP-N-acetylmuramoyl-L-alanine--D-glutamate ligase [Colwellia hornerae]TWX56944.1 UDP-N-acetylmuramoyl-L-alanine--D-glutamate ligase [Colwellia hornerae]TWX62331.1 UDP-N-acetylmuramoyl-L-alanine--D-glutamate ligase [Colwellia hornerae]TWX72337.1 UDP-N-acetylmuramoyl-L-alanine--D-glutamate ligase [Colwellia hornerae]